MDHTISNKREAWNTIFIFLGIVTILSSVFHYAIVNLYPSSTYIGGLMWCPALAAFLTLKIKGRPMSALPWQWGNWKYIKLSYLVPFIYVFITYILIWIFGFGNMASSETILEWGKELGLFGIGSLSPTATAIIAVILMASVGVVRAMATTLGEEIGWRGFFVFELRKVMSFTSVSIFSGFLWALWHWPIIVYYGDNVTLELACFFVFIISISFVLTYYTFKSNSLWPAVIFHAVSNVYVQKIFPPLTEQVENSEHWLGENGIMFALVTLVFGLVFWRKGVAEKF